MAPAVSREVRQLILALDMPTEIHCPESRNREDAITALCMLLHRLAYPTRLCDVQMQMGWERTRFSRITRATALFLYNRWKHLLRFNPIRLTPEKLVDYATIIQNKGCPLDCVVAFIDGTLEETARPSRNQRLVYNGWKRKHCLKYHVVTAPDGLVIHVYGPVEGRRHDSTVLKQSGLTDILEKHFWSPEHKRLFIYGDPAYAISGHILAPYKGLTLDRAQQKFNGKMSKVREAVEWSFKEANSQFAFFNFALNQKVLLQPVGLFYLVGLLLCNCHTILHRPQIPQYFDCTPPTLAEYFQGEPVDDEHMDRWCLTSPWEEVPDDEAEVVYDIDAEDDNDDDDD
ncbi:hypothetical protein K435DRAFT_113884 [Dendrothele bispora CBS 962.96]|uniref:DDE Tnp4 domain-containing protein n=1 Tax=Dendrothele bispora (strain CBS 962.96) TaxID=1314807 RepID=A0A4S8M2B9_DENBC|nr:hypothetical protein K435DRAFT_113884 [Dendrothele bispora CBS 962.96]